MTDLVAPAPSVYTHRFRSLRYAVECPSRLISPSLPSIYFVGPAAIPPGSQGTTLNRLSYTVLSDENFSL